MLSSTPVLPLGSFNHQETETTSSGYTRQRGDVTPNTELLEIPRQHRLSFFFFPLLLLLLSNSGTFGGVLYKHVWRDHHPSDCLQNESRHCRPDNGGAPAAAALTCAGRDEQGCLGSGFD